MCFAQANREWSKFAQRCAPASARVSVFAIVIALVWVQASVFAVFVSEFVRASCLSGRVNACVSASEFASVFASVFVFGRFVTLARLLSVEVQHVEAAQPKRRYQTR